MFLEGLGDFITGLFGGGGGGSALADSSTGLLPEAGGGVADAVGGATQLAGPGAAAAGGAGGGGLDFSGLFGGAKDFLGGVGSAAKGALPFAQLGLGGLGIANAVRGSQQAADFAKTAKRGLQLQERAATPLTNFGESQLRAAQAGQVTPAVQAQIDLWKQAALAKAKDYFARAGDPDGTAYLQYAALIERQAEAMKVSAIQEESAQGGRALAGAASAAGGLTQQAQQQQGSLDNLIAQANQALARLAGGVA